MKVEFTKEQYKNLMKLVSIGTMVINGPKINKNKEIYEVEDLVNANAKEAGLEEFVIFNEEEKRYIQNEKIYAEFQDDIDEFNEMMFWEYLAIELTKHDIVKRDTEHLSDKDYSKLFKDIEHGIKHKLMNDGLEKLGFSE